jgi:hypothetical protein
MAVRISAIVAPSLISIARAGSLGDHPAFSDQFPLTTSDGSADARPDDRRNKERPAGQHAGGTAESHAEARWRYRRRESRSGPAW